MNKKAVELGWRYIIIMLIAIILLFLVIVWYAELGTQIKGMISNFFNVF